MKTTFSRVLHFSFGLFSLLALMLAGCNAENNTAEPPAQAAPGPGAAPVFDTMEYRIRLVTVADGLSYPYSIAMLPDGDILVTEMPGRLRVIRHGKLAAEPIVGIPEVYHNGSSKGLMDIALHPDFADNGIVYFTYNKSSDKGVTEVLARGTFDGSRLNDVEDVFVANAWARTDGRQNSRIAFTADATIYMSASAGGGSGLVRAHQMDDHAGKILRLRHDGTVPSDNPFVRRSGYLPEIFTAGHQNIHGMLVHPETGEVWSLEHGDEVNILRPGANYAAGIPDDVPNPPNIEFTEPHIFWRDPDIHPSGMAFYTGDHFPNWKGNLFIGGLRTEQLHRVAFVNDAPAVRENLFSNIGQWVRDVRQGVDGLIYFTTYDDPDASGRVMRIEPVE
jgi:glucose/arabinose dehydrogenase